MMDRSDTTPVDKDLWNQIRKKYDQLEEKNRRMREFIERQAEPFNDAHMLLTEMDYIE